MTGKMNPVLEVRRGGQPETWNGYRRWDKLYALADSLPAQSPDEGNVEWGAIQVEEREDARRAQSAIHYWAMQKRNRDLPIYVRTRVQPDPQDETRWLMWLRVIEDTA